MSKDTLSVLLVGPRRMAALAERLRAVAPAAGITVVAAAAEGEPHLASAEIVVMADRVTPAYATAPRLRWLHLYPTGIDHVAIPALRRAAFPITHKVEASVVPLAEHVMALLLAIARRLSDYRDLQLAREWRHHSTWPTTGGLRQLAGSTLGIVGLGNVGRAVARRARAFDMRVLGLRRRMAEPVPDVDELLPPERLDGLLAASDYVVLATSLNDATWHLIGEAQLAVMRRSAWLINIGRGPLVDQPALVAALREERIGGAALDVFEQEPLPAESPLWAMPNVIVTPHAGGSGPDNESEAADEIVANFTRYLAGRPLGGLVDPADIPTRTDLPKH